MQRTPRASEPERAPTGVQEIVVVHALTWLVLGGAVGLLLAKFAGKSGEVAMRRAMGASRSAIFWQNLVEIAVIGALGGLAGIGMAWLGLRGVESLYRGYQHLVHLDPTMLAAAIALSVISAVAAGLYPVWRVSRLAPAGLLKTQ